MVENNLLRAFCALGCAFWVSMLSAQTVTNQPAPAVTNRPGVSRPMDFAGLRRYREANAKLPPPAVGENRVVFFGDSITEAWNRYHKEFFIGRPYINRGISGQTTQSMLIRFRPDVIALKPKVVVILAGINDVAGNTGPATLEDIEGNLTSMVELAKANGIRVVLSSVLPADRLPWRSELSNPTEKVLALNAWIKDYAAKHSCVYLDYFSAMVDAQNAMKKELQEDAVHPNRAGYDVMEPLAEKAVAEALAAK
jgi:lysophospholipase L1-like esterase